MNSSHDYILELCQLANIARDQIAIADSQIKNNVLAEVVKQINSNRENILENNNLDLKNAKENNLDSAKIDRLTLNNDKINSIIKTIEEIIKLDDPVGKILYQTNRDNGLNLKRISTPIGLFLAIYEARPNVTSDISALSLKSGNAVILRSSKDCYFSSKIIAKFFRNALTKFNLDPNIITFVEDSTYDALNKLLKMNKFIDVVIPRGGKNLISFVMTNSNIAMFNHLDGNCHTYINQDADLLKAQKILFNAKMRRTSICGATETVLIDRKIAKKIIPIIVEDLTNANCEIRGDQESQAIDSRIKFATDEDYYTEFLDKILALKIVDNCDEAIAHIAKYGSSHTESIITEDEITAQKFFKMVNSAIVMHNASTQFADGYEFGMGGEVGIATGKLHARGPIGLEQLTTFKYLVNAKCGIRS
jgi:glutamate-5-semialdehyde dehydrogenase